MPDLSILGNYPLLQFMAGLGIIAVMLLAFGSGKRDPVRPGFFSRGETSVYFDGPLKQALELLLRLVTATERMPGTAAEFNTLREQAAALIKETRHSLRADIQSHIAATDKERSELQARLEGQVSELGKRVHSLEMDMAGLKARRRSRP